MTKQPFLVVTAAELRDYTLANLYELQTLCMESIREPLLCDLEPDKALATMSKIGPSIAKLTDEHTKIDLLKHMQIHPDSTVATKINNLNTAMLQGKITPHEAELGCQMLERELSPQRVDMLREFIKSQSGPELIEHSSLSGELPSRLVN